jgi:hypothetical protein
MSKLIRDWDLDKYQRQFEDTDPKQKIRKKKKQFKDDEKKRDNK